MSGMCCSGRAVSCCMDDCPEDRGHADADTALLEACRAALGRRNMGCCGEKSANWCLMCQDELLVLDRLSERLGVPPAGGAPVSDPSLSADR